MDVTQTLVTRARAVGFSMHIATLNQLTPGTGVTAGKEFLFRHPAYGGVVFYKAGSKLTHQRARALLQGHKP
jgi:hypothetical protein